MKPRHSEHNLHSPKSMKIASQERIHFDDTLQFGAQVYPNAKSNDNFGCSCGGRGLEKARDDSSMGIWKKVKSKKEVTLQAQRDKRKVHFATLMDKRHLENAELDPKSQMYEGCVVLRCAIVEDNSGANAVFTEQGSSASQMAAKIMDVIGR